MVSQGIDVAVIGGGPAGLGAAIKAKEAGLDKAVIIERGRYLGGLLDQCIHNGFGLSYFHEDLTGPEYAERFIEKARDTGVESLLQTMVVKLSPDRSIVISNESGTQHLQPKTIILAMGCRERSRESLSIPGTRPAGVFTAGTAQRYVNREGYIPGKEIVILGSGDVGMIVARRLTLEGVKVKAVVEVLPYVGGLIRNEVQCLRDFDIPILTCHTVTEIHGSERVEGVTIAGVDSSWQPIAGTEKRLECDTVLISAGLIPENELSRMAGIVMDPITGGPVIDEHMETSIPGIFSAGNVVHVNDLVDNVTWEGEVAGASAASAAIGKLMKGKAKVSLRAGENVRYIIPQSVSFGETVTLSLRVKEPAQRVRISVGGLISRSLQAVKPSEMIKITISSQDWQKSSAEVNEVSVKCESRG